MLRKCSSELAGGIPQCVFPYIFLLCFIPAADLITDLLQHHAATKEMAPGLFKDKPQNAGAQMENSLALTAISILHSVESRQFE